MPLPNHWEAYFHQNALHNVYMRCPHCDTPSTFAVTNVGQDPAGTKIIYYAILQCNSTRCRKRTYVITTKNGAQNADQDRQTDSLTFYPSGPELTAHKSIPDLIAKDWVGHKNASTWEPRRPQR